MDGTESNESEIYGSVHASPRWRPPLSVPNPRGCQVQAKFSDMFLPLPGHINLIEHHTETPWGVVVCSWPYLLPKHKNRWCGRSKLLFIAATQCWFYRRNPTNTIVCEGEKWLPVFLPTWITPFCRKNIISAPSYRHFKEDSWTRLYHTQNAHNSSSVMASRLQDPTPVVLWYNNVLWFHCVLTLFAVLSVAAWLWSSRLAV